MLTHAALKTTVVLVVAAATVCGVAGCRTGSPAPVPATSPTVAAITAPVAFHVQLDANQTLSLRTPPADCPGLDGQIQLGSGRRLSLAAFATSCRPDTSRPGNGRHGVYRTTADIPAESRAGAVTFRTALGQATAFSQPYYECTNACRDYTEPVAVITLEHPSDPAYPALVVVADKGSIGPDQLETVLSTQLQP